MNCGTRLETWFRSHSNYAIICRDKEQIDNLLRIAEIDNWSSYDPTYKYLCEGFVYFCGWRDFGGINLCYGSESYFRRSEDIKKYTPIEFHDLMRELGECVDVSLLEMLEHHDI